MPSSVEDKIAPSSRVTPVRRLVFPRPSRCSHANWQEVRQSAWELLLKRTMDVVVAGALLLLAGPLMALIALVVHWESAGPVLYRSRRMGKKRSAFTCLKFRTMRVDADRQKDDLRKNNERHGPFFKIASDPRITRVGRILRRYSLDELPQLWNVLRGEMSLVGPRPHPLDDCERYQPDDFRRLQATPGLTGLWQVTARSDPSFQRCLALDLDYIEHWSLGLDLRILCRTIPEVLHGGGV